MTARLDDRALFADFLQFERSVFGDPPPLSTYDAYLIRYGEYRFVFDAMGFCRGDAVLDVGCETNILMHYLASRGMKVTAIDIDPSVEAAVRQYEALVRTATQSDFSIRFIAQDATRLCLETSYDKVIAVSSIEHMFSATGDGDQQAVAGIASVLKPGGLVAITVPMSNGQPFHESPTGDARYHGPYRLYTFDMLRERLLSCPDLEVESVCYLAHRTPSSDDSGEFLRFWTNELTPDERARWAWAHPVFQNVFNPQITEDEGLSKPASVNTALICLRKL
jgi:SAM-dependent methyltransferase